MTFYQAIVASFKWRVLALLITAAILIFNNIPLGQASLITLETQLALFLGQTIWIYLTGR